MHPYGRPGIGSIEDLDAATVEDVRAFHAQYYRPDNAVLVVSGNFNQAQLDLGSINISTSSRPTRAILRVTRLSRSACAAVTYTVYAPNVPLPAVMISYP